MKIRIRILVAISIIIVSNVIQAQVNYIAGKQVFKEIEEPERKAFSFATCSAAFGIGKSMEENTSSQYARYETLIESSNKAIAMVLIEEFTNKEVKHQTLDSAWRKAQEAAVNWPKVQVQDMLTDAKIAGPKGRSDWMARIQETLNVCTDNVPYQLTLSKRLDALLKSPVFQSN